MIINEAKKTEDSGNENGAKRIMRDVKLQHKQWLPSYEQRWRARGHDLVSSVRFLHLFYAKRIIKINFHVSKEIR